MSYAELFDQQSEQDSSFDKTLSGTSTHLRALDLGDFLELDLPARRSLLHPWLTEKGTAMVYSPRGIGKTLLALSVGYTVASGGELLGWTGTGAAQGLVRRRRNDRGSNAAQIGRDSQGLQR